MVAFHFVLTGELPSFDRGISNWDTLIFFQHKSVCSPFLRNESYGQYEMDAHVHNEDEETGKRFGWKLMGSG